MENKQEIEGCFPWLRDPASSLASMLANNQMPHALLLNGATGTGRRALALWLAAEILDFKTRIDRQCLMEALTPDPETGMLAEPTHPDLLVLQPLPEKRIVSVDQVRSLVQFMHLTSHQRGAKIAVIYPAQALNRNAANALLKTLEEPPAGSLILLISDLPSQLPATVVSRCHRLRITIPGHRESVRWLEVQPEIQKAAVSDWESVLRFSGGAPLLALELVQSGFPALDRQLEGDVRDLLHRKRTPREVAEQWVKESKKRGDKEIGLCLHWLYCRVSRVVRSQIGRRDSGSQSTGSAAHLQNRAKNLNMHHCFTYLEELAECRRLRSTTLNQELNMTNLLMWWYGGFSAP